MTNNTTFLFIDYTLDLNTLKRAYGFYEYTGLMKYTFENETRFGVDAIVSNRNKINLEANLSLLNYIPQSAFVKYPENNITKYKYNGHIYNVIIDYGNYNLSKKNIVRLFFYRFFNGKKYREKLKDILELKYLKI